MVCQSRVWRPICDTDWNYEDATVLCKGSGHSEYGTNITLNDVHHKLRIFYMHLILAIGGHLFFLRIKGDP